MQDWQIRVVAEKQDLDEKIAKLTSFIRNHGETIADSDLSLLRIQLKTMEAYSTVLGERASLFEERQ